MRTESPLKLISENKKAFHDYALLESWEAGIALVGSEVKSLRDKQVTIKDAYVDIIGTEAFVRNLHISEYKASSQQNHAPERVRKLLLNRKEIDYLSGALQAKGLTCIVIKIYLKNGRVKLQIALVKGKKNIDKREAIKKRDVEARLRQVKGKQAKGR